MEEKETMKERENKEENERLRPLETGSHDKQAQYTKQTGHLNIRKINYNTHKMGLIY